MENNSLCPYKAGLYIRLSREDGDKSESLSVTNQKQLLRDYVDRSDDLAIYDFYVDDGYSGTNFDRPDFLRMLCDIEDGKIQAVIVKDLSRLGRDNIKTSTYINEYFPSHKVRFIAINDGIDKQFFDFDTSTDMMMEVKNLFNGFYPKDISQKVRSTFRNKQNNGQFIGAFASYGYKKDELDHNKLVIDEEAAKVVKRIYDMYIGGLGQNTIAKILNDEGVLSPSCYKQRNGMNYRNGNKRDNESLWTYSTVRTVLRNEIYAGNMVQNKAFRMVCKKEAVTLPKDKWIIVNGTHEAIIEQNRWQMVQELLAHNTRQTKLTQNVHIFAGLIRCKECGKAMVKVRRRGINYFNCGSYNRFGRQFCSMHAITEKQLTQIILGDLNGIIAGVSNLTEIIEKEVTKSKESQKANKTTVEKLKAERNKKSQKKDNLYYDYSEGLISREDLIKYKERLINEIAGIDERIADLQGEEHKSRISPWVERLLRIGRIDKLDRATVVELISMIYIYENNTIEIIYNFSGESDGILPKEVVAI